MGFSLFSGGIFKKKVEELDSQSLHLQWRPLPLCQHMAHFPAGLDPNRMKVMGLEVIERIDSFGSTIVLQVLNGHAETTKLVFCLF